MSAKTNTKSRLGRGLNSLIKGPAVAVELDDPASNTKTGSYEAVADAPAIDRVRINKPGGAMEVPVDRISPNPHQPRRDFDEAELAELAQSIQQDGILQPLIVTESKEAGSQDGQYTLIAGERRLRAARQLGLPAVPCILREATERQMIEWAVIENIQRSNLNPIERGRAYRDCMDRFSISQQEVAERLGQARATVANYLRILDLADEAQKMVASGQVSFGHAKVLAGLADNSQRQVHLARRVVAEGLSVRKLEKLVSQASKAAGPTETPDTPKKPAYVRDMEQQLTEALGTRVTILPGRAKNTGRVVVEYYSLDDFDRISTCLGVKAGD